MTIRFDKRVEAAFLYLSVMGILGRYWVLPAITWWQQALLFVMTLMLLNGVWAFHYAFHHWLNHRYPFERNISKRIVIQLLGGWTVVKLVLLLCSLFILPRIVPTLSESVNRLTMLTLSAVIFLVNVVISLGFIASYLFQRWQENQLRAAQLEKEKVQVQLDSLKNQINPHFLFNSLSSLDSLIHDDPELASRFLRQLSKVFRYVIQHKEQELVSLKTELDFVRNYVSLLQTRFDGAFMVRYQVTDDALEEQIVPVTLQILIENAIKHNVISEARPLTVTITANNGYLEIQNPIQRKRQVESSNGQGLKNLKLLYSYLSERPVAVDEAATVFRVRIPLLT